MNIRLMDPRELFADAPDVMKDSLWMRERLDAMPQEVFVSDDKVPGGHFTTYFGVISLRDYYKNHAIKALYYLHELDHYDFLMSMREFARVPGQHWTFLEWANIIERSESRASYVSECEVYLAIPELRELTFPHKIWIDGMLREVSGISFNQMRRQHILTRIDDDRTRAYTQPRHDNWLERQIANYWANTGKWLAIWAGPHKVYFERVAKPNAIHSDDLVKEMRPAYRFVEEHMSDPNWMDSHEEWLTEHSWFWQQGMEFEEVYNESNKWFGNRLLET